jgi:hypothetical protein
MSTYGQNIPLTVEPIGAEDCTALSLIKVAKSQTNKDYDVNMLWNATPQNPNGANPIDTITTAIRRGLFNTVTHTVDYLWTSYFDTTIGGEIDAFTNTCRNMDAAQSSCMINGKWYSNWNLCPAGSVMPQGDTSISGHSFVFVDYTIVNGANFAMIDAHQGYHLLMPQEVFNTEVAKNDVGCIMPTNLQINAKRTRTVLQWISELLIKLQILYN